MLYCMGNCNLPMNNVSPHKYYFHAFFSSYNTPFHLETPLGRKGIVLYFMFMLAIIEVSNKTIAIPFGGTKYGRLVFLIIKFTNTTYKQIMECVMNKVSALGTINLKK